MYLLIAAGCCVFLYIALKLTYRKKKRVPNRRYHSGGDSEGETIPLTRFAVSLSFMPRRSQLSRDGYAVTPQPWFHEDMTKADAKFLLTSARTDGAFVVISDGKEGYFLCLNFAGGVCFDDCHRAGTTH